MTPAEKNGKMNLPQPIPRRRIAITVGDVAGVGTEVAIKATQELEGQPDTELILYGPKLVIEQCSETLGIEIPCKIEDVGALTPNQFQPGIFSAATGLASFQAVELAIQHAMNGTVDAIVTGPIQKEAWKAAGISYPGHTELLADRTQTADFCMMLTSDEISCCLATIHIPIADVPKSLSIEVIENAIRHASKALCRKLGRPASITVCGLNPHSGENGQFSYGEEDQVIRPAIDRAKESGIQVIGPVPPDTAFTPRVRNETDCYVCMYHDQGLIPLKALSFDDAVNVTLGLPIIRTSVDHGTALDLAWKGRASHTSMVAAIHFALETSRVKNSIFNPQDGRANF